MPPVNRIADYADDMRAWRQHLHKMPELEFDCHETAAYVAERLSAFGVDSIDTGIATSGLVAIIEGTGEGPTIGLRADMDALPITEVRDLPYKSQNVGKMHACGHDGHTTMLLGAARYLAETRKFSGRVALIFQPAEEGGAGGQVMCEEGIMERYGIAQVYGLHNWPGLDAGKIGTRVGALMAAADTFEITIRGKGSHAAMPHQSVDPVVIAAQVVQALQTIPARMTDPLEPVVLSVTQINAGTVHNVIPAFATMGGTVRTLKPGLNMEVAAQIEEICGNIARAWGAEAQVSYAPGYPPTVNHDEGVAFAAKVAAEVVGEDNVDLGFPPSMGAEDFAYMLQERPGAYLFVGQGDTAGLHHPEYDFNDEIAPIGASLLARLVETAQPL